jgi:hypothetical protein
VVKDLLGQVVQDIAVAAREALHEAGRVVVVLQRDSRQLEPGNPTFGPILQGGHGRCGKLSPSHGTEQGRRLLEGEAQIGLPELGQLAAGPPPRQRQRRVGATGDHQPQRRGEVLEQELQRLVDLRCLDQVVVVHHQHNGLGRIRQLVDQCGHEPFERDG